MNLRNFGMGKDSMEERIHGEIQYTVDTLEKSIGMSSVLPWMAAFTLIRDTDIKLLIFDNVTMWSSMKLHFLVS